MIDTALILNKLDAVRVETLRRLDGLTQEQLDWVPPAGSAAGREESWSLGVIFMHLAIDEHYLREQLARPLLEGIRPPEGITFFPPPPPYGASKDVIQYWLDRARTMTRRLIEHWPANANLEIKHAGGLRPMNGAEWLESYGGHEAVHHRQIDALVAQIAATMTA